MLGFLPYVIAAACGAALMGVALFASRRFNPGRAPALPKQTLSELQRYRAAVDTCDDSIYLVDRETMLFVDASVSACERTGYRYEDLMRIGPQDLLKESREDLIRGYDELIATAPEGHPQRAHQPVSGRPRKLRRIESARPASRRPLDHRDDIAGRDPAKSGRTRGAALRPHVRRVERHQRSHHARGHAGGSLPARLRGRGARRPAAGRQHLYAGRRIGGAQVVAAAGESAEKLRAMPAVD